MELRHLRYFKAVAELLSFSRAAERLRVGQPALSRQIRDLEEELGARLLDRTHVRVQLTDAGRTFFAHTCKILAQVDIATASVQQTMEGLGGELIICNDWRLSHRFVLGSIAEFRAQFPQVQVTLRDLHIHEQLTALRTRQVHLGFLVDHEFAGGDELRSFPLLKSELMVLVGANHRLAASERVKIAALKDDEWITTRHEESPGLREFITQVCRLSGFTPRFARPVRTLESVMARVATGYGVCLFPDFLLGTVSSSPLVRPLRSDLPQIELSAVWHVAENSKLLQQFLSILRRQVASTGAGSTAR